MKDRMICMTFSDGEAGVTLGANYRYITTPVDLTIVAVSASPSADDAGLTVDINDDGSAAISAVACATKATPGTWLTPTTGGTNTPVFVAGGSVLSLDANNAAADTAITVQVWALVGE